MKRTCASLFHILRTVRRISASKYQTAAVAEKKDLKLATISFTFPTNKFRKNNHSSNEIYQRQEETFDSQI